MLYLENIHSSLFHFLSYLRLPHSNQLLLQDNRPKVSQGRRVYNIHRISSLNNKCHIQASSWFLGRNIRLPGSNNSTSHSRNDLRFDLYLCSLVQNYLHDSYLRFVCDLWDILRDLPTCMRCYIQRKWGYLLLYLVLRLFNLFNFLFGFLLHF